MNGSEFKTLWDSLCQSNCVDMWSPYMRGCFQNSFNGIWEPEVGLFTAGIVTCSSETNSIQDGSVSVQTPTTRALEVAQLNGVHSSFFITLLHPYCNDHAKMPAVKKVYLESQKIALFKTVQFNGRSINLAKAVLYNIVHGKNISRC